MPESRDRLSRPDDVRAMFALRRQSIGGLSILLDEPETSSGTPIRWGATAMTGTRGPMGVAATRGGGGFGRGSLGTPRNRNRHGRNSHRSPAAMGSENLLSGSFTARPRTFNE
ncbi:UV-B-insensitive 4-like protein [Actinidia rufa]|uniref:UV-B-insensitive 4-like protein n=1 Tax=Actinidia rufa TaxID=165716 RepID=A0A7J0E4L1_9ERIC|nr:UV-B-insensitive 4-like protein [Actinidia rufa]